MHKPRFSAGLYADNSALEPLWAALSGHAVAVVSGHDHNYQRLKPEREVTQIVVGAGGRSHYALDRSDTRLEAGDDENFGALHSRLGHDGFQHTFVTAGGAEFDPHAQPCVPHRTYLPIGVPAEDQGADIDAGAVQLLSSPAGGFRPTGKLFLQENKDGINKAGDRFGEASATGDFNGDGYSDLAVGSPGEDAGTLADAGVVHLLYGSATGITNTGAVQLDQSGAGAGATEAGDRFGAALSAGDFNGDGKDDLAVGSPDEDGGSTPDVGVVAILTGKATGINATGNRQLTQSGANVGGTEAGDRFGAALSAGDFNGDGKADLSAGSPDEDTGSADAAGVIGILMGSATGIGIDGTGNSHFTQSGAGAGGTEAGDRFGFALLAVDFNGDGKDDLSACSPDED